MLLLVSVLLVGCGSGVNSDFTEEYNKNAEKYDAKKLNEEDFSEVEKEENMSWQTLFESQHFDLLTRLKDGKNVSGYQLRVKDLMEFVSKEGMAYDAALTLSDTLGISIQKMNENISELILNGESEYKDGDYEIKMFSLDLNKTSATINIDKE